MLGLKLIHGGKRAPLYCIWLLFQGQGQNSHNPSHDTKYIHHSALLDFENSDK